MRAIAAWIKEKTGIDVEALAKKTGDAVSQAKNIAVTASGRAADVVQEKAGEAADAAKRTAVEAGKWAAENTTIGKGVTDLKKRWKAAAALVEGTSPGKSALMAQIDKAGMTAAEKAALMGNVRGRVGFFPEV